MDIFIEKIIKKKFTAKEKALVMGGFVITIVLMFASFFFFMFIAGGGGKFYGLSIAMPILIAFVYYLLVRNIKIEFEYSLTNGDLEITKIINQRKRKPLFSGECRDFEIICRLGGSRDNSSYHKIPLKIEAVKTMDRKDDIFFIVANSEKGRQVIYFEPDERMQEAFKQVVPSKTFLE